jgi:hypothetical protein
MQSDHEGSESSESPVIAADDDSSSDSASSYHPPPAAVKKKKPVSSKTPSKVPSKVTSKPPAAKVVTPASASSSTPSSSKSTKRRRVSSSSESSSSDDDDDESPPKRRHRSSKKKSKKSSKDKKSDKGKRHRKKKKLPPPSSSEESSDEESPPPPPPKPRTTDTFIERRRVLMNDLTTFFEEHALESSSKKLLHKILAMVRETECDSSKKANSALYVPSPRASAAAAPAPAPLPKESCLKCKEMVEKRDIHERDLTGRGTCVKCLIEISRQVKCSFCKQSGKELKNGLCRGCTRSRQLFELAARKCTMCKEEEATGPGGLCISCTMCQNLLKGSKSSVPDPPSAAAASSSSSSSSIKPLLTKRPQPNNSSSSMASPAKKPKLSSRLTSQLATLEQDDYTPPAHSSAAVAPASAAAAAAEPSLPLALRGFKPELERLADDDPRRKPFQLDHEHGIYKDRGQQANVDAIEASIDDSGFAIDTSPKGTGKSVCLATVGHKYDYVFIISPVGGVRADHLATCRLQGTGVAAALSYSTLVGHTGKPLSHPWLRRIDTIEVGGRTRNGTVSKRPLIRFERTEMLVALMQTYRILFVLDEVHNARSQASPRAIALATMFALIFDSSTGKRHQGCRSAVLLQSGTLFDRREQVANILQMIGQLPININKANPLFKVQPKKGEIELYSVQGFYDRCRQLDPETADIIYRRYITFPKKLLSVAPCAGPVKMGTTERCSLFLYNLFVKILQVRHGSCMPAYRHPGFIIRNSFFCFEKQEDLDAYNQAVSGFEAAQKQVDESRKKKDGPVTSMTHVFAQHKNVDASKIPIAIRVVRNRLESNPHCKVIIAVNYTEDAHRLRDALAEYQPLMLTGEESATENQRIILQKAFQDSHYEKVNGKKVLRDRLIIANSTMASEGINLHDTSKDSKNPRWSYGMPSYHSIRSDQFTARTHRYGLGPNAEINFRWLYARNTIGPLEYKGGALVHVCAEQNVLERNANRSQVLKEVSVGGHSPAEMLDYAIDYEQEIETVPGGPMVSIGKGNFEVGNGIDLTKESDSGDESDAESMYSSRPAAASSAAAASSSPLYQATAADEGEADHEGFCEEAEDDEEEEEEDQEDEDFNPDEHHSAGEEEDIEIDDE